MIDSKDRKSVIKEQFLSFASLYRSAGQSQTDLRKRARNGTKKKMKATSVDLNHIGLKLKNTSWAHSENSEAAIGLDSGAPRRQLKIFHLFMKFWFSVFLVTKKGSNQ